MKINRLRDKKLIVKSEELRVENEKIRKMEKQLRVINSLKIVFTKWSCRTPDLIRGGIQRL